ncbi:kinase-interacting family protein-like [Andrographis paniculata]|uniref:kinase-interacting family protein-like n=1 Tax=Andrographis paniculata TaxID=175694 RepID=UPI0021E7EBB1|nr:kinase-interacting family protein-like [Andrographis paniculata]
MVAEITGGGGEYSAAVAVAVASIGRRRMGLDKPSWLLCTIADMDEKMKILTTKLPEENPSDDGSAARANSYNGERLQLPALLRELYNEYLSLADRYCHVLAKNTSSPAMYANSEEESGEGDPGEVVDFDSESSASFHDSTLSNVEAKEMDADTVVAALVMKTVEYDIATRELAAAEKRRAESSRKVELQRNLVDVLESERLILLNDNATLEYRVSAMVEENKCLASESLFLKRKAVELARCALKSNEDHRALTRKIEDLEGEIHRLEKQNREYFEQIMNHSERNMSFKGREGANLDVLGTAGLSKCFSFDMKRDDDRRDVDARIDRGRVSNLWGSVKKLNLFDRGGSARR